MGGKYRHPCSMPFGVTVAITGIPQTSAKITAVHKHHLCIPSTGAACTLHIASPPRTNGHITRGHAHGDELLLNAVGNGPA
eukprot:m.1084843 g.1084843  ORF g.1084843 m.1084843 type:complete len:81 (+) comp24275_c0_seq8:365-607(+)